MLGLLTVAVASVLPIAETEIVPGSAPAVSPDGRQLAFERFDGRNVVVGVCDAADGGNVRWIDGIGSSSGYPNWTPSGGLVYTRGVGRTTAYQAFVGGQRNGFEICLKENGRVRSLTSGRFADYSPVVSADGKALWFVTTRGVGEGKGIWKSPVSSNLAWLDLTDSTAEPRVVACPSNGKNSGFIGPAVSPDGRYLVCGHLVHFFSGWRIVGARIPEVPEGKWHLLTPRKMVAHSPRWHPNGRILCFTGFREGDAGWGVWTMDVRNGAMRRLTDGESPCFSPAGDALYYGRDGRIFRRACGAEDEPSGPAADADAEDYPSERIVWRSGEAADMRTELAFGEDDTFFVRAMADADRADGLLVRGEYAHPEDGFDLSVAKGRAVFSVAALSGAKSTVEVPLPASGPLTIVGLRHDHALYLSVNGAAPVGGRFDDGRPMPLDHPKAMSAGRARAEVGRGWPDGVPTLRGRKELFR